MAEPFPTPLNTPRQPPNSIEAEQSLLGALMLSEHAWDKVADKLDESDFYRETHRLIFRAIGELNEDHQPTDAVTVADWFAKHDLMDRVEGGAYLTMLANDTPGPSNILGYAEIVREKSILRQLIEIGTEVADAALNPQGQSSKEVLETAEQKIYAIAEQGMRSSGTYTHVKDVMVRAMDRLNELQDNEGDITGVPSGFSALDQRTAGLQPTDLIIVAGRPAMGKCLEREAEIVLDDGTVRTIEQIVQERPGRVATLNADWKLERAEPEAYVDDGFKPVFEVESGLGRRVRTTATHPFLTPAGWKPLGELQPGDLIAVPREMPVFGTDTMRDCEVRLLGYFIGDGGLTGPTPMFTAENPAIRKDFAEAVDEFGGVRPVQRVQAERAASFAVATDHELTDGLRHGFAAHLATVLDARGSTARALAEDLDVAPATVHYWKTGRNVPDDDTLARLADVLDVEVAARAGEDPDQARRNRPNPVRLWLEELGLYGRDAHAKHVPDAVFRLPREQLAVFLNRLLATDGWISTYATGQVQAGFSSVSERLARQVQHLLLRFGILARLRLRPIKDRDARRTSWQLQITHAESLRRLVEEIGIHGKDDAVARARTALAGRKPHSNVDLLPKELWVEIDRARGALTWAEVARRAGLPASNLHPYRRRIGRERLAKIGMALQDRNLINIAASDVTWDRIERIEALGKRQVYDLTIPETHNFVADDICVHNTSFAMNIAAAAAIKSNIPVAVFSMEMSDLQLVLRLFSSLGQIGQNKLRTGRLDNQDYVNLQSAMSMLKKANILIDETPALSPTELRARARRMKREHGIGLILIDYLQLMQVPGNKENRATQIGEISRSLKALAKELDVPVIALSQLNRALEQRPNKRPVMADLRESGSIEQDADMILFIYRDEVYNEDSPDKGKAEIIIGKHRNGATGDFFLTFQGEYLRFRDYIDDRYDMHE
ncbi:replicative DNA helicase [Wenzhouxiangella sp. XN79A]|nr:replicative DNA helicase [Wenzhouxiangella sp. XN79A]